MSHPEDRVGEARVVARPRRSPRVFLVVQFPRPVRQRGVHAAPEAGHRRVRGGGAENRSVEVTRRAGYAVQIYCVAAKRTSAVMINCMKQIFKLVYPFFVLDYYVKV